MPRIRLLAELRWIAVALLAGALSVTCMAAQVELLTPEQHATLWAVQRALGLVALAVGLGGQAWDVVVARRAKRPRAAEREAGGETAGDGGAGAYRVGADSGLAGAVRGRGDGAG